MPLPHRTFQKILGGKLSLVLALAAVFALGFGAHWLTSRKAPDASEAAAHVPSAPQATMWTCSMHPQIRQPKPGKCPLCGMDLIPVDTGSETLTGLRQLVVSPEARALMNVQVTPVTRRSVSADVRMVGKVDYDETRLKHVTAWIPGRLDRLYVDYTGVEVQQGDHMVYIYSPELYAAQQELIEAIRSSRNRGAENSLLAQTGIDLVESAREKLRLWGMTPEQIAEIEKRDKPTDHMTIHAPMSGIVIAKLRQEGDYVKTGDRIYTLADLSQVWVKMDAYESDLQWLRYGQEVEFTTEAYPGETFTGRVAFIDPVLNERTRTAKVRVNVPNPEGKLKPEMFVRGEVRAKIAQGGKVIDPDLAGKWISPMHPEIVKDKPGTCDICGMPLVRAETLGYVAPENPAELPLVIPVSAALVTGTRAIVYVEDPAAEKPTFHGQEIVLGPRAGDYYIVEHGLQEGELVVTDGNFKIDSALQIQAKPSMMTPQGGGGGGHQHGGEGPSASHEPDLAGPPIDLPTVLRQQLAGLQSRLSHLQQAAGTGEVEAIRRAFVEFGKGVQEVDASQLEGHPRMVWEELAMLMMNDVVEGRAILTGEQGRRLAGKLAQTAARLDQQFGLSRMKHFVQFDVPVEFQNQLQQLIDAYWKLGDALASDDFSAAQKTLPALKHAFRQIDMGLLQAEKPHKAWMQERGNLEEIIASLEKAADIKQLRAAFEPLSGEMQVLVMQFGVGAKQPVFELHCPMAFGNRGAIWLQQDEQARNPYFGSTMLKCADRIERISGDAADPEGAEGTK